MLAPVAAPVPATAPRPSVLLVQRDADDREMYAQFLSLFNFQVFEASTAGEALEMIEDIEQAVNAGSTNRAGHVWGHAPA
jgi:hypothetical protein